MGKETPKHIIEAVAERTGINKEVVRIISREIFKEIYNHIIDGKTISVPLLGKFQLGKIKEKKIKTLFGEKTIKNWIVVKFLPSRTLKERLNEKNKK